MRHIPVLLHEVIEYLNPQRGEVIVDGTIDGGGHAEAILERIGPHGTLLGIDWDESVIARAREKFRRAKNVVLRRGNYADTAAIMKEAGVGKADGIILDLGFSSEQLKSSGRGFSFLPERGEEPLIMTYDTGRPPVHALLKKLKRDELVSILRRYGEERYAYRIAEAIREGFQRKSIRTSGELAEIIRSAVPKNYERGRIDPATRTFQALRIYANDELNNLRRTLESMPNVLRSGGRMVVISFQSLEDAIVKKFFRVHSEKNTGKILTKKPIVASSEEKQDNPRSRSAKLRAFRMN